MAAHTEDRAKTATLTTSTVDTVAITGGARYIEVINHGNVAFPIYVLIGDTIQAPTVAGDDCSVVLQGERVRFRSTGPSVGVIVSLISGGAATYTVEGVM